MKKMISLLMVCALMISTVVPINAIEAGNDLQLISMQMGQLILPFLSTSEFGVTIENCDNLYVGNPITSYAYEADVLINTYQQYPIIFKGNEKMEVIGLAKVITYPTGEKTIDYGVDCAPEINTYFEENGDSPFCLIYTENGVYIGTEMEEFCLKEYKTDSLVAVTQVDIALSDFEYTAINAQMKINQPVMPASTYAVEHESLDIEYIHQNGWTCWAASIASIVNYLFGLNEDIQSILDIAYDMDISVTNGVNINNSKKILDTFGGSNTRYNTYITYTRLKGYIDNGYPAYIRGDSVTDNEEGGHASVAYGYYYGGSGSKYMYYMEPNTGFRSAAFPSSGGIIFTTGSYSYLNDAYILCRD